MDFVVSVVGSAILRFLDAMHSRVHGHQYEAYLIEDVGFAWIPDTTLLVG